MKAKSLSLTATALAVGCIALFGVMAQPETEPNIYAPSNRLVLTNKWTGGTNFLTLTNRVWVQFDGGSVIVRVTDSEWALITNHYADRLVTNEIKFYGK